MIVVFVASVTVPANLTDTLHIEAAVANAYASLMFLAAIPANITAGWVINHLPNRHNLLPAAFLTTGLLCVWSFHLRCVGAVVPYRIALGFTSNFIPTAVFTLAPETVPNVAYAGLALAIVIVGANLGAVTGPPALGAILSSGDQVQDKRHVSDQGIAGRFTFILIKRECFSTPQIRFRAESFNT